MKAVGSLKIVTPPAQLFSTAVAKSFLRVDDNGEDSLIDAMVVAATSLAEEFLNKKLLTQTLEFYMDRFPVSQSKEEYWDGVRDGALSTLFNKTDVIEFTTGPLQSVSSFKIYSETDVEETVDVNSYIVDLAGPRGRVALRPGYTWPSTILRPINALKFTFVAGYGNSSATVPGPIVEAIKQTVAYLYENRGDADLKPALPKVALLLLRPYRTENL